MASLGKSVPIKAKRNMNSSFAPYTLSSPAQSLTQALNAPFQYDYETNFNGLSSHSRLHQGLSTDLIRRVSRLRREPIQIRLFRERAFTWWQKLDIPKWSLFAPPAPECNLQIFYSVPSQDSLTKFKLEDTVNQLNLPAATQGDRKPVAVDTVVGSVSVLATLKLQLLKSGIIFCSLTQAIIQYPWLVQKYLGKVVPVADNFYAALNSAIFSDGSFCFIPKDTKCDVELSTYFRIEDETSGQFERTLVVAETGSYVSYLEGCTAIKYDDNQFHAAVVELLAEAGAEIKYSTVQNWYTGDENGEGGLYNLVTKRGMCVGSQAKISWAQVEMGSAITWKYPSCILMGERSQGEFYSVSFTNSLQQADTGTKMIHIGTGSKSKIISKSISTGLSKNIYRGSVEIGPRAYQAQNFTKCDSILLGPDSLTCTFPYIIASTNKCHVEHEATVQPINQDQLFYLRQRGLPEEYCIGLLVSGFCEEVCEQLPLEFGVETGFLLALKVEESLG